MNIRAELTEQVTRRVAIVRRLDQQGNWHYALLVDNLRELPLSFARVGGRQGPTAIAKIDGYPYSGLGYDHMDAARHAAHDLADAAEGYTPRELAYHWLEMTDLQCRAVAKGERCESREKAWQRHQDAADYHRSWREADTAAAIAGALD